MITERPEILYECVEPLHQNGSSSITGALGFIPSNIGAGTIPGISTLRDRIVKHMEEKCLARPSDNVVRNNAYYFNVFC